MDEALKKSDVARLVSLFAAVPGCVRVKNIDVPRFRVLRTPRVRKKSSKFFNSNLSSCLRVIMFLQQFVPLCFLTRQANPST